MPRQPRLDIPGLLHHVIVRGIERGIIFYDDTDRRSFLDRFSNLLSATGTECLAWALLPNHFHLLLRPQKTSLSHLMRRLLTGYAVTFNCRHKRSGHLFQNRYKSIICEENVYLLELIRYIHLNPLRANLVPDMETLDNYSWCGHAELMGKHSGIGLSSDAVLGIFDEKLISARRTYHKFLADGLKMNEPPELTGGGLRRSQTLTATGEKLLDFDDRILGSGKFVTSLRQKGVLEPDEITRITLIELQQVIEAFYQLGNQEMFNRGRKNNVAQARTLFCYCGVRLLHNSGAEVGRHLKIGSSSVSRSVRKGEKMINENDKIKEWVEKTLKQ